MTQARERDVASSFVTLASSLAAGDDVVDLRPLAPMSSIAWAGHDN